MLANEQLIHTFYTSFQNKDYAGMQACYSENAVFNDEVFKDLNAKEVRKMWEMLIKKGHDLQLSFKNVQANDYEGSAEWTATYTFSKTKRKVVNHIKANFVFQDGKILQHTDHFNFHKWAGQALGTTGFLLGRTNFLKTKVQKTAVESLEEYMTRG
ncbi:MAG TPA: ketosteroid isomerase [Sphingobacteriaceae bacterium]|nr:ketosteroid isomerase [Sphingobacteriaceae bacterium]